jgi:anti-sigma regulatory factor (Ser/Thr protein kinase)
MREMTAVVQEISIRLTPEAASVQEARRALEQFRGLVPAEKLADARLVVSELVTNELRYAGLSEGDVITVHLAARRGRIEGRVCSVGEGFVLPSRPRQDLPGGWGLVIVDAVCDRWGACRESEQSCIWFEIRWGEGGSQPSG